MKHMHDPWSVLTQARLARQRRMSEIEDELARPSLPPGFEWDALKRGLERELEDLKTIARTINQWKPK